MGLPDEPATPGLLRRCARAGAHLGEAFWQTVYPPRCFGCEAGLLWTLPAGLCHACARAVDYLDTRACRFCGAAAGEHAELGKGCSRCMPSRLQFTRAVAVAAYDGPVRGLLHGFKFRGQKRLAAPLGALVAARVRQEELACDRVMAVPLHPRRLRERGYNQAELLARRVAADLALPFDTATLRRIRHTRAQATLKARMRLENPVGAFVAVGDLDGARVLLVDDILTTGTTVSECATALRKAGAARVYVAVFAR